MGEGERERERQRPEGMGEGERERGGRRNSGRGRENVGLGFCTGEGGEYPNDMRVFMSFKYLIITCPNID